MMETKVDYLKHSNDSLQNKSQQLEETLQVLKEKVTVQQNNLTVQQNNLLELLQNQARIEAEAYSKGLSDGVTNANFKNKNDQTIVLPPKLDKTTLSTLIVDSFKKVHPKKHPRNCAMVAASAVWDLYNGACKSHLVDWSTEIIQQKNPYRQAEEIAKVMDLCAGQLNITGYKQLRKCLEAKTKKKTSQEATVGFVAIGTSNKQCMLLKRWQGRKSHTKCCPTTKLMASSLIMRRHFCT
jgi:hypothetical protein